MIALQQLASMELPAMIGLALFIVNVHQAKRAYCVILTMHASQILAILEPSVTLAQLMVHITARVRVVSKA
jgi:hypothetical protein